MNDKITSLISLGTIVLILSVLSGSYYTGQFLYEFLISIEADEHISMAAAVLLNIILAIAGLSFGLGKYYSWAETKYGGK